MRSIQRLSPLRVSSVAATSSSQPASATASPPDRTRWVAIQRNRTSGAGRQYRAIIDLIRELRALGVYCRLFGQREDLDSAVREHPEAPPLAVVAAGGDGTIVDLLNRHPDVPIAVLPLGTENLIAKNFGIPRRDGRFVARMIAAGRTRRIDLGRIGDRKFALMASCGVDAHVLHGAHAARRGHITQLHYLNPLLHSLWSYKYPPLRVYIDHQPQPIEGGMAIVANLPPYALGMPLSPPADDSDGKLHVRVFPHQSTFQLLLDLANVHLRWGGPWPGCTDVAATHIRIESDTPTPIQADGDPAGTTPIEIDAVPAGATLVVP
jgi:diacylglycerol kinase (ATP)